MGENVLKNSIESKSVKELQSTNSLLAQKQKEETYEGANLKVSDYT